MQVVILCGGLGTRLAEDTAMRPKPMIEIGGMPILWHIMKLYSHYGFADFVLCLGFKGDVIRDYFLKYDAMNSDVRVLIGDRRVEHLTSTAHDQRWRVILAETGLMTPTGGRLKRIERYIEGDLFLATYGDGLADIDLRAVLAFHRSHGRLATVVGVRPPSPFGELGVVTGSRVASFVEKPRVGGSLVSGGFFVFERGVLEYLADDAVLEREPLERLAREEQLMVYMHDGYWQSMDTLRDKRELEAQWASGRPAWKVW